MGKLTILIEMLSLKLFFLVFIIASCSSGCSYSSVESSESNETIAKGSISNNLLSILDDVEGVRISGSLIFNVLTRFSCFLARIFVLSWTFQQFTVNFASSLQVIRCRIVFIRLECCLCARQLRLQLVNSVAASIDLHLRGGHVIRILLLV